MKTIFQHFLYKKFGLGKKMSKAKDRFESLQPGLLVYYIPEDFDDAHALLDGPTLDRLQERGFIFGPIIRGNRRLESLDAAALEKVGLTQISSAKEALRLEVESLRQALTKIATLNEICRSSLAERILKNAQRIARAALKGES